MSDAFGSIYADAYDLFYCDKDYDAECDLLERLFQTHGDSSIRRILDLGCGTGNHAISLAQRGYEVVGVDRSESMLALAQGKVVGLSRGSVAFHQGDIRSVNLGQDFDAALMMSAVLGYQLENEDVLSALKTARRHLRAGGLLVFDVWYGPAVLHQRPSQHIRVIPIKDGKILRVASGELDVRRHICTVDYHIWKLEGERLAAETEETHSMRYFFSQELDLFLAESGFTLTRLAAFPDFDQDVDEMTWNVLGVAYAV